MNLLEQMMEDVTCTCECGCRNVTRDFPENKFNTQCAMCHYFHR